MGDEVSEGGGCRVNELEAVVVSKPDGTACLANMVGTRPESLSCQSCSLGFECGQIHVGSCKGYKSQSKDDKTKASGDTGMISTPLSLMRRLTWSV